MGLGVASLMEPRGESWTWILEGSADGAGEGLGVGAERSGPETESGGPEGAVELGVGGAGI